MKKNKVTLSRARSRAIFENPDTLKGHLADQLKMGRLALVLGAGASFGFGLPSWDSLVDRCLKAAGMVRSPGKSAESLAEDIHRDACDSDDIKFARLVHEALYETFDKSVRALRSNELLAAVAALAMASRRGSVARVISFNFDDMLERYLRQSGFQMRSVSELPCWSSNHDVTVFHPHGILGSDIPSDQINEAVVFTLLDYDRLHTIRSRQLWRSLQVDIFSASTCLFIGLSGNDPNLRSSMVDAKEIHVGRSQYAFWGVRFSDDPGDPNLGMWETRGVFQSTLPSYDELPTFLFDVCQRAVR